MKRSELEIILGNFIPDGVVPYATELLITHKIQLKISKPRASKYGDYTLAAPGEPQRISINRDLNPFHFLVTFLHEVAHLKSFENYGRYIKAHGTEWQREFQRLGLPVFQQKVLPADIHNALMLYLSKPKASSCSDPVLLKTLKKYDTRKPGIMHVDDVEFGVPFKTRDGKVFIKVEKMRTRYKCHLLPGKQLYLVPGILECELV